MIGGEDHHRVAQSDMRIDKVQQLSDLLIDAQSNVHRFLAIWPKAVANIVVRGKTHGQDVRVLARAELLVRNRLFGKGHQQIIREGRIVQRLIEELAGRLNAAGNHVREIVCVA